MTDDQMDCERSSADVEVSHSESTMEAIVDYENRLYSEELQRERSQEIPRVTRSSYASSSNVWYSELTSDELTASGISLTDDEIVKRATFFVKTFVGELEEKLSQFSKEAKPGSKIRKTGRIVDQIDSTIKSTVPPGMRLIPDKINECIGFVSSKEHRKKAKRISAIISGLSKDEIRKASVEAGLEIFQNFDKRFIGVTDVSSFSWKRGIEKLAIDAASRAINYISSSNEKGEFSVPDITKGVVLGGSKNNTLTQHLLKKPAELLKLEECQSGYPVKDEQSGEIWMTSELYEKVGIKKIEGETIKYYKLKEHDCAEKCGYRLLFTWELENWEELGQKYVLSETSEERYVHIFDEEKKKGLAGNILKEINGNDSTKRKDIEELYEKLKNFQMKKEESIRPFLFNLDYLPQFFVERGNMLKMLNEKLDIKKQEEMQPMVLIHGGYGVGKSELAKSYAHSIKSKGNVVWINAKSCNTLSNSFYSLAKKLGIPTEGYKGIQKINPDMEGKERVDYNDVQKKNIESIVYNVYEKLQDVESYFIFDNASEYREIERFLPASGFVFGGKQPYVLITSRNKDWKEEIEKINLDKGFSSAEALMFIEKALEIEDNSHLQIDEMVKLARGLHYFPLALKAATAYIKQEKINIIKYLEQYDKAIKESESDSLKAQGISPELFTTLKVNFDQIRGEKNIGQPAFDILYCMAYLSPDQINIEEIFLQKKAAKDKQQILDAFDQLHKFSVIELEESIARIHSGVQKIVKVEKEQAGTEEETLREIMTSFCLTNANHVKSVWIHASKYSKLVNEFIDSLYDGSTILHLLAKDGNEEVIKLILEKVDSSKLSKIVNLVNEKGFTPLEYAVMHGYLEIVKYLVEKGADVNLQDEGGISYIHWAANGSNLEIVKYLVEQGAYVNLQDASGMSSMHWAANGSNLEIVKYLVEQGGSVDLQDEDGVSPVHWAAKNGHLDIVKYLVGKGSNVNLKDIDNNTILDCAVIANHLDIIKYLCELGAKMCQESKDFLYRYAITNHDKSIICYLMKAQLIVNPLKRKSGTICTQVLMEERPRTLGLQNYTLSDSGKYQYTSSKKRRLENTSAVSEENASNIQLLQGNQNLPSDISMRFQDESTVNLTNKIPMSSFNSVAVEPVNDKNLQVG